MDTSAKLIVGVVLLVIILVTFNRACQSAGTDHHAPAVESTPAPEPAPQPITQASWETATSNMTDAQVLTAREVARHLVGYCGTHDPYGNTWSKVERIDVERHSISDHGKDVMIWELRAHFPKGWKFDVLRDNVLWYFVDDVDRVIPTKDVAGEVCGGWPRDQWSRLGE
jgi:hypothetical protein